MSGPHFVRDEIEEELDLHLERSTVLNPVDRRKSYEICHCSVHFLRRLF